MVKDSGTQVKHHGANCACANSSGILGHRKYAFKHKLKVYYRASFTQNFRSLSIKMRARAWATMWKSSLLPWSQIREHWARAKRSESLGHRKYFYKHNLKVYHRGSFWDHLWLVLSKQFNTVRWWDPEEVVWSSFLRYKVSHLYHLFSSMEFPCRLFMGSRHGRLVPIATAHYHNPDGISY